MVSVFRKGADVRKGLSNILAEGKDIRAYAEALAKKAQIDRLGNQVAIADYCDDGFRLTYFGPAPDALQQLVIKLLDGVMEQVRAMSVRVESAEKLLRVVCDDDWVRLDQDDLIALGLGQGQ